MNKKIILFAASAGIMLATGVPALAQGDRNHDRRHHEHHDRDHHRHRHHDGDHDRGDQHEHDHD